MVFVVVPVPRSLRQPSSITLFRFLFGYLRTKWDSSRSGAVGSAGVVDGLWQNEGQENVYGMSVHRAGEMTKLAKWILSLHIIFVVVYFVSGVLSIVVGLTRTETSEWELLMAQNSTIDDIEGIQATGIMGILGSIIGILGSIGMFFLVRSAIKRDHRDLICCTLFCDGICAACNCCFVVVGFLFIVGLMAGKESLTDLCECSSGITTQCIIGDTGPTVCSDCFDKPKCLQTVKESQDLIGVAVVAFVFITILVLAQIVCCIVAAVGLSRARNRMQSFPFCRVPPSKETGLGQPNIVVGQPVLGTVVGEAREPTASRA